MEYVAPGAIYSSRLSLGPDYTGLTGTISYRLLDNDSTVDDPVFGPVTTGILEDPTGSGDYVLYAGTAPTTAGHYARAWQNGAGTALIYDDDLIVTRTAVTPSTPSGNEYVTRTELKTYLNITSANQDSVIDIAIEAASRAIDAYKGTRYYTTAETRYYTPNGGLRLEVDDLVTMGTVTVDRIGDFSYSETWTEGTEYVLEPANNPLEDKPQRALVRVPRAGKSFPTTPQSVKIVATFGWTTTPTLVRSAAHILAARIYNRRDAVYGVLSVGLADGIAARLPKTDPDVAQLLDAVDARPPRLLA